MQAPKRAATGGNLAMAPIDPRLLANAIRFLSIDAIERVGEGHPGTPLGAADTTTALFTRHLKFNPRGPLWFDRDRFVESNGPIGSSAWVRGTLARRWGPPTPPRPCSRGT